MRPPHDDKHMNLMDWILALPLLYAAYAGFREGIAAQLGGLIGLIAGVWLAWRFGEDVGGWMGLEEPIAVAAGFLAVLVGVMIALALLGRLLRGLFRFAGLGPFDAIGGVVLGVLKMALLLSVLLLAFIPVNRAGGWISPRTLERSRLYKPVSQIAPMAFPYLQELKSRVWPEGMSTPQTDSDE